MLWLAQEMKHHRLDHREAAHALGVEQCGSRADGAAVGVPDKVCRCTAESHHCIDDGDLVGDEIVTPGGPRAGTTVADEIGREHAVSIAQTLDQRPPLTAEAR